MLACNDFFGSLLGLTIKSSRPRSEIINMGLHRKDSLRKLASRLFKGGVICSVVFCWSICAQTVATAKKSPEDSLQTAEEYYTQGHFQQAEQELRSVLFEFPTNGTANEMLALVLSAEGRDAEGTAFFEQAVKANPSSQKARENLAANYAKCGKKALAEAEFKRLASSDPDNFELTHNFGEFYLKVGEIAKAVPLLKTAQHLKPADYENGYDLSLALLMLNRLVEAQQQLEALLAIRETSELHSLLAEVYEKRGMFLNAAQHYQRAAQMDPSEDTVVAWGSELLRHSNLTEAEQVFNSGVGLYPESWRMYTGLGITEHMLGHAGDATKALIRAVDLNPTDPRSYSFLAVIDPVPADLMPEAVSRFQNYAQQNPKRAQAQFFYAVKLWQADELLNQTQNSGKIEALLRTAVALDPALADAYMQLGILYARRGQYNRAAAEFEQTIRLDPAQAAAHYHLGLALVRLGQKEQGDEELKTFRKLRSEHNDDVVVAFLMTKQNEVK